MVSVSSTKGLTHARERCAATPSVSPQMWKAMLVLLLLQLLVLQVPVLLRLLVLLVLLLQLPR